MKFLKDNLGGIAACAFEILVGVLLLVNPIGFTYGIIICTGLIFMAGGLISIVKYFRTKAEVAAKSQTLVKGLVILLAGSFCTFRTGWFIITFPVITLIYGVVLLIMGLVKIQWMADAIRMKKDKWYLAAISALLSISCGIVIITSPFSTTAILWIFTGISLIIEAIVDTVSMLLSNKEGKISRNSTESEAVYSGTMEEK